MMIDGTDNEIEALIDRTNDYLYNLMGHMHSVSELFKDDTFKQCRDDISLNSDVDNVYRDFMSIYDQIQQIQDIRSDIEELIYGTPSTDNGGDDETGI